MSSKCPLCGQVLPDGIDAHRQLDKLTKSARADEANRVRQDLEEKLASEMDALRQKAERSVSRKMDSQLAKLRREAKLSEERAERADREARLKVERLKGAHEREIARAQKEASRSASERLRMDVQRLENQQGKERLRYEKENLQLQQKLEKMHRQLEKQSNEDRGGEAEVDLYQQLREKFPHDRVERVGKGQKGADIVHYIISDSEEVGRIVYECKNVTAWQNAFVAKLKQSRTRYSTPYAVLVTRAFPRKHGKFCMINGVPVVAPELALPLAEIVRESIARIGKLQGSAGGHNERGMQLLRYLRSEEFHTHFEAIADEVDALRQLQRKEKDSHELTWKKQAGFLDRLEDSRRSIKTRIASIANGTSPARKPRLVA